MCCMKCEEKVKEVVLDMDGKLCYNQISTFLHKLNGHERLHMHYIWVPIERLFVWVADKTLIARHEFDCFPACSVNTSSLDLFYAWGDIMGHTFANCRCGDCILWPMESEGYCHWECGSITASKEGEVHQEDVWNLVSVNPSPNSRKRRRRDLLLAMAEIMYYPTTNSFRHTTNPFSMTRIPSPAITECTTILSSPTQITSNMSGITEVGYPGPWMLRSNRFKY